MKRIKGFTLVELLVVIAIISILAAIAVPRISGYILKAQGVRAQAEVANISMALTKLLSDAGVKDMSSLFEPDMADVLRGLRNIDGDDVTVEYNGVRMPNPDLELNSEVLYKLLRQGRNAEIDGLKEELRQKLGVEYMNLPQDPWKQQYTCLPGPWPRTFNVGTATVQAAVTVRCYRLGEGDPEENPGDYVTYSYNTAAKNAAEDKIPGNPPADNLPGFPASKEEPFYVWSFGANTINNQLFSNESMDAVYMGGGDDINNWDNQQGWQTFYN